MATPGPREAPPLGAHQRLAAGKKKLEEYKLRKKPNKATDNGTSSPITNENIFNPTVASMTQNNNIHSELTNGKSLATPPENFFDQPIHFQGQYPNSNTPENLPLAGALFPMQSNSEDFVINGSIVQEQNYANPAIFKDEAMEEVIPISEAIKLKQQLQFHMQTVEFLVSEKNNLSSKVGELEAAISKIQNINSDINDRLNISRHRASCLEMENSNLKEKVEEMQHHMSAALEENFKYKNVESTHANQCRDLKEELQETKSLIGNKISENNELKSRIEELTFHVNAAELRFQQLNQGYPQMQSNSLIEQNQMLAHQIEELGRKIKELDSEKNQSNAQYQQYVQQLNNQLESMSQKHETLLLENENFINRESNLMQQMDSLEKQLQTTTIAKPEVKAKDATEDIAQIELVVKEMGEENQNLKSAIEEKEATLQSYLGQIKINHNHIEELTSTINLMQSEKMDIAKLNAAIESDRIAAQKAMTQNTKLKSELESLQEAYKKMTESKLELAELLQAEKNLSKTLTLTMADNEEKLKDTTSKLYAKDEEMIRLQAESSMLEKEAQKYSNISNNCEGHDHSSDKTKIELEFLKEHSKVMNENNEKLMQIILKHGISFDEETTDVDVKMIESEDVGIEANEESFRVTKSDNSKHIPATEAMRKLQERFTKLMDDMANLSDDKQRLEHLVLQLQGETETIGEYIALYQRQRSILKQREYEKDIQLNQLAQEKENLKEQLDQLSQLVEQLIKESGVKYPKPNAEVETIQTAAQINHLLTEIKESHLVESNQVNVDNFQPCSWCSGKLINI